MLSAFTTFAVKGNLSRIRLAFSATTSAMPWYEGCVTPATCGKMTTRSWLATGSLGSMGSYTAHSGIVQEHDAAPFAMMYRTFQATSVPKPPRCPLFSASSVAS